MLFQLGTVDIPGVEITKKIRLEIFHRRYQLSSSDTRYFPDSKLVYQNQEPQAKFQGVDTICAMMELKLSGKLLARASDTDFRE